MSNKITGVIPKGGEATSCPSCRSDAVGSELNSKTSKYCFDCKQWFTTSNQKEK